MQFPTQNWKRNPRPWYRSIWETAVVDPLRSLCRRCFKSKTMGDWSCCFLQSMPQWTHCCRVEKNVKGNAGNLRTDRVFWKTLSPQWPILFGCIPFQRKLDRRESGWSAHGQWIILMDLRLLSQVVLTTSPPPRFGRISSRTGGGTNRRKSDRS